MRLYYKTRSLCPTCHELLPAEVLARDGRIYLERTCPDHGKAVGLVCSDQRWYEALPRYDVEPIKPFSAPRGVERGCPDDCGLCPRHRQIAGVAAFEVSNRCNAACPACLADNQRTFELDLAQIERGVETLLRSQERVDVVALSGGEPTVHPRLIEIIELLERDEIGRIVINTNGIRIADDDGLLDALAEHPSVFVCLHQDGSGARALRGVSPSLQRRALDRLCERGIKAIPLILAAKGVNEQELGGLISSLLTRSPAVRSVNISLMAFTGRGGGSFAADPLTRLTIPEAIACTKGGGRFGERDFMPLPMPNPLCAAVGYFLVMAGELTALLPLAPMDEVIEHTKNGHLGQVGKGLESFLRRTIDRIYANPDAYSDAEKLLRRFRRLLELLFGEARSAAERQELAEAHIKSVYFFQYMDAWTFDAERLCKCSCQHVLPEGQIVPSCGYYAYHRRFDERFGGRPRDGSR